MPITFVPSPGDVLMCNFEGFKPPEMTKNRKVVILSPRCRIGFPSTYIVVPISKTTPNQLEGCHCEFAPGKYGFFHATESVWAKADMVSCVAASRLDRVEHNGRFSRVQIRAVDLLAVRSAVLHALGMEKWRELETKSATETSDLLSSINGAEKAK
jgi:uncharacterized protein YifN (PemK superfamily)